MRLFVSTVVILLLQLPAAAQAQQDTPELSQSMVITAAKMKYPHLANVEIDVIGISPQGRKATAKIIANSVLVSLDFELVETGTGLFWSLSGSSASQPGDAGDQQAEQPSRQPAQTTAEELSNEPAADRFNPPIDQNQFDLRPQSDPPSMPYQEFIKSFLSTAADGSRQQLLQYYFKESDFDWRKVEAEDGEDPRMVLMNSRDEFMQQAELLATVLQQARSWRILSYVTRRSNPVERAMLRQIMPRATRYIKSLIVEMDVDNQPARITFEGVTYVGSGWRIGVIAELDVPQPEPF